MRYDKLDLIALQDPTVAAGRRGPVAISPKRIGNYHVPHDGRKKRERLEVLAAEMRSRDRWAALRVPRPVAGLKGTSEGSSRTDGA